jgi:hypothetical protein
MPLVHWVVLPASEACPTPSPAKHTAYIQVDQVYISLFKNILQVFALCVPMHVHLTLNRQNFGWLVH